MVVEILRVVSCGIVGIECKAAHGTFPGVGNVLYSDCSLGYIDIYICQNSLNCAFHCMSVSP